MAIKVGEKAPIFSLFSTEKDEVSLETLITNNNVVLVFFPLAFSDSCSNEMHELLKWESDFHKHKASIVGISVDSLFALKKFKDEMKIPFQLLSDFNKTVSRSFDVLHETFIFALRGVSKRAVFIIDQNGIIRHKQVLEDANLLPDFEAVSISLRKM